MNAREAILARLNAAPKAPMPSANTSAYFGKTLFPWVDETERLAHWADTMRRFKAQIIWVNQEDFLPKLTQWFGIQGFRHALLPATELGHRIQSSLNAPQGHFQGKTTLFTQTIDEWKDSLFQEFDVGVSSVRAGIAKTGTLILIPTPQEPRSLSLVPEVHVAVFDVASLYDDFHSALQHLKLAEAMPTNVVLVSSPSKTSDIQLTLAFGAHGPRELVVFALLPSHLDVQTMENAIVAYREKTA